MLAGANYLDLASDPRVVAAADEAARRHGCAAGGSRLISGNTAAHEALESELADFAQAPAALTFSTGYMANLGVITALAGPDDVVVSDSLNHASIIDACRLSRAATRVFAHNDPSDLKRVAEACTGFRRRLLVTDGVYSMDGDTARLRELIPVAREHDMISVLDDAHGFGVLGSGGRGTAEHEGVSVDITIGNLGKAFGGFGAFVLCSERVREYLINRSRSFIFTCGLAPGAVGAARAALEIVRAEPERRSRLLARAEALRCGLRDAGWNTGPTQTQVVPLIVGENDAAMALCEAALDRGVYAQGIRYPTVPRGTARLRLTPTAGHSEDDIETALDVFRALH